jgi:glutamyl/glutaminyl-tRNA synthetase
LNPDRTKMSKSDPDPAKARLASLQTYVEDGFVPEAVRNYLCLLGWSPKDNREVLSIDDIVKLFDLPQILRNNARFDTLKLTWMNGEYIRAMPLARFIELARPFAGGHDDPKVLGLVKEKIKLLTELPEWVTYFFTEEYPFDPEAVKKSCSAPQTTERLTKLGDKFAAVSLWDAANLETALKALAAEMGIKTGELIHPCRVAVSGKSAGPSLYHMRGWGEPPRNSAHDAAEQNHDCPDSVDPDLCVADAGLHPRVSAGSGIGVGAGAGLRGLRHRRHFRCSGRLYRAPVSSEE